MFYIVIFFAVFIPRIIIILIALFSHWLGQAYTSFIWPLLGWFFMPYTTLAYMGAMIRNNHQVTGGWLILVIAAVIVDLRGTWLLKRTR